MITFRGDRGSPGARRRDDAVDGNVSGACDQAVLPARDRFGQRRVQPRLAFDLRAQERLVLTGRHRPLEAVDVCRGRPADYAMAVAKPDFGRSRSVSRPKLRCSSSDSPHDARNAATRSRTGGVLSMRNVPSGSPNALSAACA
jgi:hypothetical protein